MFLSPGSGSLIRFWVGEAVFEALEKLSEESFEMSGKSVVGPIPAIVHSG